MNRIALGGNPKNVDLILERAANAILQLHVQDEDGVAINITGWTFKLALKNVWSDASPIVVWTVTPIALLTGDIDVSLTGTQTNASVAGVFTIPDCGVYDLFSTDASGIVSKRMYGSFTINPSVSY